MRTRRPRSAFALAVSILAGFLNRPQQYAIDYLREENRVLRQMLGGRRLRFTDAQRKRLAIRGKALGRALLKGIATLVQPDTILDRRRRDRETDARIELAVRQRGGSSTSGARRGVRGT